MSTHDSHSSSGSGSESSDDDDVETTGLIATRAKRVTAGNLYASLRANLDDEDVLKELLAEDEDDVGDYEGSDDDDGEDAIDSSSDEEDAGPPKDGEAEDLAGEKELQRRERVEAQKKRKMQEARLRIPTNRQKRVKLADGVKTEDGATAPKHKKKSERSNWLPTEADAPTRQSGRSLAVANRESTHANLKQSLERSEKQKRIMENAAQRETVKKRMEFSQAKRMEVVAKIEKQTEREFGRWEREEKEKERLREEAALMKRRRGIEGEVIRWWSGSAMWEGEKMKVRRVGKVEEVRDEVESTKGGKKIEPAAETGAGTPAPSIPPSVSTDTHGRPTPEPSAGSTEVMAPTAQAPAEPWLHGIHDYAAQPPPPVAPPVPPPQHTHHSQHKPGASITTEPGSQQPHAYSAPPLPAPHINAWSTTTPQSYAPSPSTSLHPTAYHPYQVHQNWALQTPHQPPTTQLIPPSPPIPLVREQAQRSLIILDHFENLEHITRRSKATFNPLEPKDIALVLLPSSYPPLTPSESKYLLSKPKKLSSIPPPVPEPCGVLAAQKGKYRDSLTGVAYRDAQGYGILRKAVKGGCTWSGVLGAWVGNEVKGEGGWGRVATGCPEGFA